MSVANGQTPDRWRRMAELESALLARLDAADDDLQRIECLDDEQRAEIHAILEAMKHDAVSHAAVVKALAGGAGREACHA